MDNTGMSDRNNRTLYLSDFVYAQADKYGKRPDVDRKASKIFEYAVVEYLEKRGVDMSDYRKAPDETE